jgi:hypothetical protein
MAKPLRVRKSPVLAVSNPRLRLRSKAKNGWTKLPLDWTTWTTARL